MDAAPNTHSQAVLVHWNRFLEKIEDLSQGTAINGQGLDIATVVAVARYSTPSYLDNGTLDNVRESAHSLATRLRDGEVIYGVNTGFGGSADTRTRQLEELQRTLIRELHSGILDVPSRAEEGSLINGDEGSRSGTKSSKRKRIASPVRNGRHTKRRNSDHKYDGDSITSGGSSTITYTLENGLPTDHPSTCMLDSWARASILVRINSLASAHSGVRTTLITTMTDLLKHDILPRIPLRGSISASGDLMPLSYIAGTLLGKPTLTVTVKDKQSGERYVTTADKALAEAAIKPIKLGPKEGLAIVNGTAVSTAVGALAIHEAHALTVLSQILTAMSVEALGGTIESFDPFFAKVRPHVGQVDASHNIYNFLSGSQLVHNPDGTEEGSLRQDRYSIRTASQWLGPILEDLLLAHQQITVECNSVTDNPLIDGSRILHGGNFQARAVTSAIEKTRLSLQSIGRMLFTQCTEMLNPKTSRGLPPNLVADEPSLSWVMKPVDIMVAALLSELGFLANPVGTHVQTAEMGNQALNSLALISARYCHTALDVLSQMTAAHLFAACQAVDLRAMHIKFLETFEPQLQLVTEEILKPVLKDQDALGNLLQALWARLDKSLEQVTSMDTVQRFHSASSMLQPIVLRFITASSQSIEALEHWTESCAETMLRSFEAARDLYSKTPNAEPFLGRASRRMYKTPDPEPEEGLDGAYSKTMPSLNTDKMTTGSYITKIYTAIRNGSLYIPVMECLREAQESNHETNGTEMNGVKDQEPTASEPAKVVDSLASESKVAV